MHKIIFVLIKFITTAVYGIVRDSENPGLWPRDSLLELLKREAEQHGTAK